MGFLKNKKTMIQMMVGLLVVSFIMIGIGNNKRREKEVTGKTEVGELYVEEQYLESKDTEELSGQQSADGKYAQMQNEAESVLEGTESLIGGNASLYETPEVSESVATESVQEESVPTESVQEVSAPTESVSVEIAQVESVPVEILPIESASVEATPEEVVSGESESVESVPVETENSVTTESAEIVACTHEFKKSIWENPTCMNGGYYNNICQKCGFVECVTVAALPHEPEDIVVQNGNCMEDTVIRHICKTCGQQISGDTRFTPQIHEWIDDVIDDREVTYCNLCGVVK